MIRPRISLPEKHRTGKCETGKYGLLGTSKRYCQESHAWVAGALGHLTYFISLLTQPVEFEIYIRLVTGDKFCHYAIFPLLYCGRFLRGLGCDFGHSRIGEGSPRQRSNLSTVYNRAENEPRHEDYERREEMMFTHVISLFLISL